MSLQQPEAGPEEPERASAELRQLQAILEAVDAAIVGKDLAGRITTWNRGAEALFGYTASEAIGQSVQLLVPARLSAEEQAIMERVQRGERVERLETLRRRKDGQEVPVSVTVSPVYDARGALVGAAKIARDISELLRAREHAEQTQRELEERVLARTEELRATNTKLEQTASQLRIAERLAHVGSWELDVTSGEMRWSEEMYRIGRLDPNKLPVYGVGDDPLVLSPDSNARLAHAIERSVRLGEGYELQLDGVHANGERWHAVSRGEPIREPTGEVRRIIGMMQDTTGREEIERQLRKTSERLELATSAAHLGVWDWDLIDGTVVCDEKMYEIFEAPTDGRARKIDFWLDTVDPQDALPLRAAFRTSLRGLGELNTSCRIELPSGAEKHVRIAGITHRDGQGNPVRLVGVAIDITEQRHAELALRRSEATQRAILANAGVAIIATDAQGTINLFNRCAEELLGYEAQVVLGKATPMLFHDAQEVALRRSQLEGEHGGQLHGATEVFPLKTRGGPADVREWTFVRRNGTRVPVMLTVTDLHEQADTIGGYLGIAFDLSQRKRIERELLNLNDLLAERSEQAESANRAKSEFIANMSHDLRTPLAAISGMAYLLGRTTLDADQRSLLGTIESSAKHLVMMVNDILDLSKIEAKQLVLDVQSFTLSALLDELGGLMAGFALGKHLELIIEPCSSARQTFKGDRVRLLQVITNLVGNAIKFTEQGAVIVKVSESRAEPGTIWYRFEVSDTGPGIEQSALNRLFTRFQRVDDARVRRTSGAGLGLAIVKELSALMGGRVGVDSALGEGSTFWCELPLVLGASSALPVDEMVSPPRLLLVEHSQAQRRAILASARCLSWLPSSAATPEEALALVEEHAARGERFDCILLDAPSPSASSSEPVLGFLRAAIERPGRRPGIVLVCAQDEERSPDLLAEVDVTLPKPVTPNMLHDAVRRALEARISMSPGAQATPADEPVARLAGVRLLVVDDAEVNREIARRILALEGATVDTACSGSAAIERLCSGDAHYDVVLMDVQMQGLDGIEAVRRLRSASPPVQVPIIALTAGALADDREQAFAAGMDDFVSKPCEPDLLVSVIRRLLGRSGSSPSAAVMGRTPPPRRESWPVIAGIDAGESFVRLGGEKDLFRFLVGRLIRELNELLDLAITVPPLSLGPQLHRLRGISGNLGARSIYDCLVAAEGALSGGDAHATVASLEQLALHTQELCKSAEALPSNPFGEPEASLQPELDDDLPVNTESLLALLRDHDLDALPQSLQLGEPLTRALGKVTYRELREAIENLNFEAAITILDRASPGSASRSAQ